MMSARAVASCSALLIAAIGLAACSGGGGSTTLAPQPAATTTPISGASGTLTLTIPRNPNAVRRGPQYVSPNSVSLRTTVKTVDGQPPTSAQAPQNPSTTVLSTGTGGNCTVGPNGETCTVAIPTPSGTVVYQFDLLDVSGHVLATNTVTLQIAAGSNPSVQAQLDGVVATVTVTAPNLQPGTSFSGPVTVNAYDASGALIFGSAPFANPFTLTDTDGSSHTSLTDGGTTGKTITDGGPNDVVILNYDGTYVPSFTITATVNGQTTTSGTVTVLNAPVTATPNTLTFVSSAGPSQNFTASQPGYNGTFSATSADATIATVSPTSGSGTFTVTPHAAGSITITVTGGGGLTTTVTVNVQGVPIIVSSKNRHAR